MDAWFGMPNEFNIFLPGNPCGKGGTGRATIYNGELIKNNPIVIFQFNEELLP